MNEAKGSTGARAWWSRVPLVVGGLLVGLVVAGELRRENRSSSAEYRSPYDGIYQQSYDSVLQHELAPGARGIVNQDGFLDRDYAKEKGESTFRIIGLGDSVTMYYTVEQANYLSLLEPALDAASPGEVEVLNFGVGGYETPQEVRMFETKGLPYAPDFVTLGYCLNDGIDFPALADAVSKQDNGFEHAQDTRSVQSVIHRALREDAAFDPEGLFEQFIAPSAHWARSESAMAELAELSKEHDFRVLVVIFPSLFDLDDYDYEPVHRAVEEMAKSHGFAVIDLLEGFRTAGLESIHDGGEDAIHPNAQGNRLIFEAMLEWFRAERPWEAP